MDRTCDWQVIDPLEAPADPPAELPRLDTFLRTLERSRLLHPSEQAAFFAENPELLTASTPSLVEALVRRGLLNDYQATRLLAGQTFGLVLGNYRIVDRIGTGGMGVVYRAEHVHMKRVVALKVLFAEEDQSAVFLRRFHSEMEALAVLRHPNIVLAFDAGEVEVPHAPSKVLRYLVMEYVPGQDLEQYVAQHGPLPIAEACDYVSQAASGLRHAHEHGLVHRDMKPSNLLLTPQQQVKILDFGLARLCRRRCTEAHTMLGTVDYMAPEQARDARSADIRADIYGLGGTLYWLLTGQKPFPGDRAPVVELLARQHDAPPALRRGRPDAPPELEAVVARMMATNPDDRYPTPLAVMQALSRFREPAVAVMTGRGTVVRSSNLSDTEPDLVLPPEMLPPDAGQRARRALIVSARPACRLACRAALEPQHLECSEAGDPAELADALARCPCDLVLIDAELPGAADLCRRLRESPPVPHLKLLLLTAGRGGDIHAAAQEAGADDAICWIGPPQELQARARLAVRLKEVEDRADRLASHLLTTNRQLEEALKLRDADLYQAQDALIFAMAKMAESRGLETGGHLLRMQQYVRALAEEAQRLPAYVNLIDDSFVRMIERCVLLHDVGKVAIPDHVLLKPGRLDAEERSIMESHTVVGAGILEAVARHHGASLAFLHMAIDIARHHHERWDGSGYPDGLAGEAIPLAARIVTVADVYDALRSKLVYKPGLPHGRAKRLILESAPGQFDPALLVAFRQCEATLEQIFAQTTD